MKPLFLKLKGSPPEEVTDPDTSGVEFTLTKDGHVGINFYWCDQNTDTARQLGLLLWALNAGTLHDACVKHLTEGMSDPENAKFIKQCFQSWSEQKDRTEQIVKPSDVFHIGHNRNKPQ